MRYTLLRRKNLRFSIIAILLGFSFCAQSQSIWTGTGDGLSWNDPNNWFSGVSPGPGENIIFDDGGTYSLFNILPYALGDILVLNGTNIDFQNFSQLLANNLTIHSGSVLVSSELSVNSIIFPSNSSSGTLTVTTGGQLEATGNLDFDGDGSTVSVDGSLSVSGNLNNINNNGSGTLLFNSGSSAIIGDWGMGQTEAETLNDEIIDNSSGGVTIGGVPLPVVLASFIGHVKEKGVLLEWVTASEINNNYFILEKSRDGISFEVTTQIEGSGDSNSSITYQYFDKNPASPITYYRLKQVDFDGTISYSEIIQVGFLTSNLDNLITVYPNPVTDRKVYIKLNHNSEIQLAVNVQIYGIKGDLFMSKTFNVHYNEDIIIDLPAKIIDQQNVILNIYSETQSLYHSLIFFE